MEGGSRRSLNGSARFQCCLRDERGQGEVRKRENPFFSLIGFGMYEKWNMKKKEILVK